MGIGPEIADMIAREAAYKPVYGTALTLGRQTVDIGPKRAENLLRSHGLTPAISDATLDTDTLQARIDGRARISDRSFLQMLGFSEVRALDVSDYEKADIIHDLNTPIPDELEGICDFLVDGSTLDNIFDPPCGLRNIARLLKPGGRCIMTNRGNAAEPGIAYTMFNPLWFFDFFVANNFRYCQVACKVHLPDRMLVYMLAPQAAMRQWGDGMVRALLTTDVTGVTVMAEKGPDSTWHYMPIQHGYRSEPDWQVFCERVGKFVEADRPPAIVGHDGPDLPNIPPGWMRVLPDGSLQNPRAPNAQAAPAAS